MISFIPERVETAPGLPVFARAGVANSNAGTIIEGIITGSLSFAPDFSANPFLKSATGFQQKVWREIMQIKRGETATYGDIAAAMGNPGLARAVGNACNANPLALIIPCHRVVGRHSLGGFAGSLSAKETLLRIERRQST